MTAKMQELAAIVPVVEVTLLEDRALVVRRGAVELPPGQARLRIEDAAPVLVDKTLAAALSLPPELAEAVRVRSVQVVRRRVAGDHDKPAALAELQATRRASQDRLAQLEQRSGQLDAELASLAQVTTLTLAEIAEDVAWARADTSDWASALDRLDAAQLELAREGKRLAEARARLRRELDDLAVREAAIGSAGARVRAALEVELDNTSGAAQRVELRVDYLVPGALWRPWHSARLIEPDGPGSGPAKLAFTCAGAVWQNTGEDWHDVDLIFSTERPSLGVAPPTLRTDTLHVRKRGPAVEVEARDQTIHTAGLGADGAGKQVARDELPGIDDGGEAIELRGRVKATIPSDGRPHRVPLFEFEAEAATALVCMPERAEAVMLRSRHANASARPLLAGPVDLIRRSGLVGRTSILYIAPGERFELGWGPEPTLRVTRTVEELEHERKLMSSWTRRPKRVRVKLSNLAATPATIEVTERIVVSEVEKVEVELIEVSRAAEPDDDGLVTWSSTLKGFGHDELELRWALVVHDDVSGML